MISMVLQERLERRQKRSRTNLAGVLVDNVQTSSSVDDRLAEPQVMLSAAMVTADHFHAITPPTSLRTTGTRLSHLPQPDKE